MTVGQLLDGVWANRTLESGIELDLLEPRETANEYKLTGSLGAVPIRAVAADAFSG